MATPYIRSASYDTNERRCRGRQPCAICGSPVRDPGKHQIVLGRGGAFVLSRDEAEAEMTRADCLGAYPVGPDCATLPQLVGCVFVYGAGLE